MKSTSYIMLRIRVQTHKQLRLITALSDERLIDTVARLTAQELARLQAQEQPAHAQEEKD